MAEGASGVQASGPSRIGLPPAAGGVVGPLRPACASCTPSLATPYCRQKSCTRLSAASFSSDHKPPHFGEMRPCGLTLVISHITRPAAPSDILPRCIRCQSLAEPLLELYWHIGETTTLFGRVRPRKVMGENRTLAIWGASFQCGELKFRHDKHAWRPPDSRSPKKCNTRHHRSPRSNIPSLDRW